jgi:hypothetical protein
MQDLEHDFPMNISLVYFFYLKERGYLSVV